MDFVRIRNKADNVDRRRLEKLGISTKRDNDDTIGQFGSGAKLAPIAALRKGIRWITVAADENGPYVMEYVSREVDGIDTVFYKYHGDTEKESSFTVDAGVLSWDEDFQIFREAFSNALDEGDYEIDRGIVDNDSFEYEPGYVDVYLSSCPEIDHVLDNFDKYFCVDSAPLVETSFGSIYAPSKKHHSRIFNKGVFVFELPGEDLAKRQTFDYGFTTLELNEERRLKSEYTLEKQLVNVLSVIPDTEDGRNFVSSVFDNEPVEFSTFITSWSVDIVSKYSHVWADVWVERFTEKAIPISAGNYADVISSNILALGYKPCVVTPTLYKILVKSGVNSPEEILGGKSNIKVIDCPPEYKDMFDHAVRTVGRYDSRIVDIPVEVMESGPNGLGLHVSHNGNSHIFISQVALEQGFRTVVETLIHELDHAVTGAQDMSRAFRDAADKRICDLILELGYDVDVQLFTDRIAVPIGYAASLGGLKYKIFATEIGSIVDIGHERFLLDEIVENDEGVMQVTENGDSFFIHVAGVTCNSTLRKL